MPCTLALRVFVADQRTQALIAGLLDYDRKRNGSRGRALTGDMPLLGLRAGDRLEPSLDLTDVSQFEKLVPPFLVLFWRPANESMAKHRCPVFSIPGVSVVSIALDMLHCLNLGVFKAYCAVALWTCMLADVFRVGRSNAHGNYALSIRRLRTALFAWYAEQRSSRPFETIYEVGNLTQGMLGTPDRPSLATKGAETGTLLEFCRDLVQTHVAEMGNKGRALLLVGTSLVRMRQLFRCGPRRLSIEQCQLAVDYAKEACALRADAGIPFTPKWHLMLHVVASIYARGNPQFYTTFVDEGFNGVLAKLANKCHRQTWHSSVLTNFKWVASRRQKPRRA